MSKVPGLKVDVYNSSWKPISERHLPYGTTQRHMPANTGERAQPYPKAGTRLPTPKGWKAEFTWVVSYIPR